MTEIVPTYAIATYGASNSKLPYMPKVTYKLRGGVIIKKQKISDNVARKKNKNVSNSDIWKPISYSQTPS